jgi:Winged helix-turn-helix DNA-binding
MSNETVIPFRSANESSKPHPFERLWGKAVRSHGYAAIPTIMVRAQRRLGVNPTQFCILVQLLEYWRLPERAPFPTKKQLADRIGLSETAIQQNMRALEVAGLIRREQNKTSAGDWGANTYHLDGLVDRIQKLEPEFAEEKKNKEAARRKVETPKHRRAIP